MKGKPKFPYQDDLLLLKAGEQLVLYLEGTAFIVRAATDNDFDINPCGMLSFQALN